MHNLINPLIMKTIYLACSSIDCLIEDIRRAFPGFDKETEYSSETGAVHLIGDIPTSFDPEGNPEAWVGAQHANVYVPERFDETIFLTRREPPRSPVNQLAV